MPPQYVCLYDNLATSTALGVPNCATCHRPMTSMKKWVDYSSVGKTSLSNFTPSCRNVRFDCHVTTGNPRRVFVVVRCALEYQDGMRGTPGWSSDNKRSFERNLRAAIGLWDGKVTFRHHATNGDTDYQPLFFVDLVYFSISAQSRLIVTSASEPVRDDGGILIYQCGDSVTLNGPYPDNRPRARTGENYQCTVRIISIAPRTYVFDTSVDNAEKEYVNSMAHEFGHMIGLPDEYDTYGAEFSTGNLVSGHVNRGDFNSDKDKCVAFWVEMLRQHGLASPAWGQYGTMPPRVHEHSVMRNIDTRDTSFIRRHYVTVLEALDYMSVNKGLGGYWSMV